MKRLTLKISNFLKSLSRGNASSRKLEKNKSQGFTLIEVMISIVISSMLLISVMGSYWVLMKTNKAAEISRELQKETHFSLIRISDSIRNYSIDYEGYEAGKLCANTDINTCQKLCVKENFFELKNDNLWMNDQPLFSDKYKVDDIYFSTAPAKNPFLNLGDRKLQIQPRTTIFIATSSKENPSIKLELQTTISSRKYRP